MSIMAFCLANAAFCLDIQHELNMAFYESFIIYTIYQYNTFQGSNPLINKVVTTFCLGTKEIQMLLKLMAHQFILCPL